MVGTDRSDGGQGLRITHARNSGIAQCWSADRLPVRRPGWMKRGSRSSDRPSKTPANALGAFGCMKEAGALRQSRSGIETEWQHQVGRADLQIA